jgi:Rhodopirellula transposase DDE domain
VPYGVYDITGNNGWVSVGTDHDTAAFAVESIRRWWNAAGTGDYPLARRLLITADAGGSNGYRTRAWKAELAALAVETGLEITVCHFPPGTQCRCLYKRKYRVRVASGRDTWSGRASMDRGFGRRAAGGCVPVGYARAGGQGAGAVRQAG